MVKVFKFGGASVKDAEAVKNMCSIIEKYGGTENLLVVVSAMGKVTNRLEELYESYTKSEATQPIIDNLYNYHSEIIAGLFSDKTAVTEALDKLFTRISGMLSKPGAWSEYDEGYDQIISMGEIISTTIIYYYLQERKANFKFIEAAKYIQTDTTWREGKVDWDWSEKLIVRDLPEILQKQCVITQGFIGGTEGNRVTTLGREGSDYTAAIFAYCLGAESVTIWKDVAGILNADPKVFKNTVKYGELSYNEAVEMTYYGATVIHPKTIKPLANKHIPLIVKSFINPDQSGTEIKQVIHDKIAPAYILKTNQILLSFSTKDFSFISEYNLSKLFSELAQLNIKINLMQNSAISFSICVDNNQRKIEKLINILKLEYKIQYNNNLQLITVKNYTEQVITELNKDKNIVLMQKTRTTYQVVYKS